MNVGFIGLGVMGEPMAGQLLRAGTPLLVWNRSPAKSAAAREAGARVAATPADVFAQTRIVLIMLRDAAAVDAVLERGTPAFAERVANHTIVHLGTTAPSYSRELEADVRAAGGRYVEAPVSGSRIPAEQARLVAMLAGERAAVDDVRPLLRPMCAETVVCGPVPNGLLMKLAVNILLITTAAGLAEAAHFAQQHGLDMLQFRDVIVAGQTSSMVSREKVAMLVERDFPVRASIANVLENNQLIVDAARDARIAAPLMQICHALFGETLDLGHGDLDMAAVVHAIEARTGLALEP
jgi:3-hydroxyisobutyrate dehydrogenase